jgi:hypothetical protein
LFPPLSSGNALNGAQSATNPGATTPTGPAGPDQTTYPNVWLPRGTAVLQALDKADAVSATVVLKIGQSGKFGSLTIGVQACVVRPPDQPADAAAFLTITDTHPDAPGFKGWMMNAEPTVAMLEHPLYDVRVLGCTT